jgi:transposase
MSGKRYPEEFKIEAVKQVADRGYTVAEVADRSGVTTKRRRLEMRFSS